MRWLEPYLGEGTPRLQQFARSQRAERGGRELEAGGELRELVLAS